MMTPLTSGMIGEPIPYLLHTDWLVTSILFLCIILTSLTLSKEKKYLIQQFKASMTSRERSSMFDESSTSGTLYKHLLILHACLMLGFCLYYYYANRLPELFEHVSHGWLLGGYALSVTVFIFLKSMLYRFINGVFFQKVRNSLWMASFFNLLIWLGILLLPIFLVIVYFDISSSLSLYMIGILIIFAKISLFWTCFSNFFEKIHGAFHLILYFCALEILPDLLYWKGMELLSNNLILNL
jgi:hypothetical protein